MPGMLVARALRSHLPHARVLSIDTTRAREVPGAVILTRDDLAGTRSRFGPVFKDQPVVAIDKVRFVGDLVAVVAAEDLDSADEAISLIEVEYEALPAVFDPREALLPSAPILHDPADFVDGSGTADTIQPGVEGFEGFPDGNLCCSAHFESGDTAKGFAGADRIFEDTYSCDPIQHAHLEPHAALAYWEGPGSLVIHCSTQDPWVVRSELAYIFKVEPSAVRVIVPSVGGGYGGKLYPRIEPVVAALARKARRPVQWVLTREEVFMTLTRHGASVRLKTGVTRDGRLIARQVEVVYDGGAYAEISPRVVVQNAPVAAGPYRIPHVSVDCHAVYTNKPPAGAFRGFGVPQIVWAYESQMDDMAHALGIDPVELRRKNLYQEGDAYLTGERLDGVGVEQCLSAVAAAIPPIARSGVREGQPRQRLVRGRGLACSIKSTMTPSNSVASVRLDPDGSLQVLASGVEIGQGYTTILAQVAADALGVSLERVRVLKPDTDVTPFDHGTKSSRLTFTVGEAVRRATIDIRGQLLDMAADKLEVARDDLVIEHDQIRVRGTNVVLGIPDAFKARFGLPVGNLYGDAVVQTTGGLAHGTYRGKDSAFWMWSAAAVEVEVDTQTGKWRLVRIASAVDVGRAINPVQCHLQNEGAATMGIGAALMEGLVHDGGQPLNSSFVSYPVPSMEDVPQDFQSVLVEAPHPDGPYGAKGVGESGLLAVAPAIGNALADALPGVRLRNLPMRPADVFAALSGAATQPGEAPR
jgi:CO/xanthine dehydrogenase Mo-binding subunit